MVQCFASINEFSCYEGANTISRAFVRKRKRQRRKKISAKTTSSQRHEIIGCRRNRERESEEKTVSMHIWSENVCHRLIDSEWIEVEMCMLLAFNARVCGSISLFFWIEVTSSERKAAAAADDLCKLYGDEDDPYDLLLQFIDLQSPAASYSRT